MEAQLRPQRGAGGKSANEASVGRPPSASASLVQRHPLHPSGRKLTSHPVIDLDVPPASTHRKSTPCPSPASSQPRRALVDDASARVISSSAGGISAQVQPFVRGHAASTTAGEVGMRRRPSDSPARRRTSGRTRQRASVPRHAKFALPRSLRHRHRTARVRARASHSAGLSRRLSPADANQATHGSGPRLDVVHRRAGIAALALDDVRHRGLGQDVTRGAGRLGEDAPWRRRQPGRRAARPAPAR